MGNILRRLETGQRWWAAEILLRAMGLGLLGLCALAALWLYHAVHLPPPHDPRALEMADAAAAFLCWSLGGALLTVGPALFRLIDLPPRYARFTHAKFTSSQRGSVR